MVRRRHQSPLAASAASRLQSPTDSETVCRHRVLQETVLHSDGIETLANITGLPHQQVLGALVFIVAAIVFGFGANLACSVVGFVYPMYKSFQAIEMTGLGVHEIEDGETKENLQRCVNLLMYWVVYTFFTVGEVFSDVLLSWIPFYYPLKLALLVWCLKYDGAQQLYRSTFGKLLKVRPLFRHRLTYVTDCSRGARHLWLCSNTSRRLLKRLSSSLSTRRRSFPMSKRAARTWHESILQASCPLGWGP